MGSDFLNFELVAQGLQEKWKDMFEFNVSNIFEVSTKKEEYEICFIRMRIIQSI